MTDAKKAMRSSTTSGSNACLSCRKVKMKCRIDLGAEKCQRCIRKSFECVFRQHRRGRRPALKMQSDSTTSVLGEGQDSGSRMGALVSNPTGFWGSSETFQPPDLLNMQAMKGQFSLQNVLSTVQGVDTLSRPSSAARSRDPIQVGLVNYHIALSLFDGFIKNLNPYVSQLDPTLHTFAYVQEKSPFLLSTILTVAAKILNPSAYPALKDHAETLFTESFRRGDKSPEVVQAILILTYWKELDDTRAWLSVGYAIRLSMDLGWHKLLPGNDQHLDIKTSLDRRKKRNVERTWLVLFVYDRSISLQTGKPRMIERSSFLESVDVWYRSPLAIPSDVLLCAFVSLRLLTSEVFELLENQRTTSLRTQHYQVESLLKIIEKQVEGWQEHWLEIAEEAGCEACNKLQIQFYGIHLRLLLSSFSLKPPLTLPSSAAAMRTAAIWTSHANAIEMLSLVAKPDISPLLYFAQDSVHVMIAYAAVFLVKLLLCVPREIRTELEKPTIDTIQATAQSFAQQAAPAKSSCWLQAKFLSNVVREFKDATRIRHQQQPPPIATTIPSTSRGQEPGLGVGTHSILNTNDPGVVGLDTNPSRMPESTQSAGPSVQRPGPRPVPSLSFSHQSAFDSSSNPMLESGHYAQQHDFTFADDAMWEAMFANAGFNITDGTFLPDAYEYQTRDNG